MSVTSQRLRNPGPLWGFGFLQRIQRIPAWALRPWLVMGTWVAVFAMPRERAHSSDFLTRVLDRPARWRDVWRHFFSYLDFLLLRLRVAGGAPARCALAPESAAEFEAFMRADEPALFGTFHFGHSDLIGFLLPLRGRRLAMIRLRVGNSEDTRMLERQFGRMVSFIWVNDSENLLFEIKAALQRGDSLAMQCDRFEFSAKTEAFHFLGARRIFPFTIYHLAVLFTRPVVFCIGLPDGAGGTRILATPVFRADPTLSTGENLQRARGHFQSILAQLETLVRQQPWLWFNFIPLNPEAAPVR